ncbi:MAG: type II secretion system F family protein [Patescibacteria group bacterium]|jgi:type IV pilus assembly protein PilC
MSIYDYRAKDFQGNTLTGVIEAPSENVAAEMLEDQKYIILALIPRQKTNVFQSSLNFLNRVPMREVVIFGRQLSVMINTAVPIVQALRILVRQTKNVTFKVILSEIADEVDGGSKLSTALGKYPQIFSSFFVYMVRSGETTGRLDETLNYLADQMEKDYDLNSRIRGAMIYPAFIMSALVAVGIVMMIFVIPQLTAVLSESGVQLPISTRILIAISSFMKNQWWLVLMILAGLFVGYRSMARSDYGKQKLDRLKLHFPVFGNLNQKIYITRFARSMSTLITGGIPLNKTLNIVADIVGNAVYRDLIIQTAEVVEDGNSIATVFMKSTEVPQMLPQMMAVGEQTGKLDLIMGKLADFYAKEVDATIGNLVALLEPMVMLVLGAGVAVMIMAIMLPMYQLSSAM